MQACPYHSVVYGIRFSVRFAPYIGPRQPAWASHYFAFNLGFEPFSKSVGVGKGALAFAADSKVSHAFVGVGPAFVATNPGLPSVASNPYGVIGCVLWWDNVVVVMGFPSASVVDVDSVQWCVSGARECQ